MIAMSPAVILCLDFQIGILPSHFKKKRREEREKVRREREVAAFSFPGMRFNLIAKLTTTSCCLGANKEGTVSASGHNGPG